MDNDPRCCGTGTCIVNGEGICWCGQVWDGEKMCMPILKSESMKSEDDLEIKQMHGNAVPLSKLKNS